MSVHACESLGDNCKLWKPRGKKENIAWLMGVKICQIRVHGPLLGFKIGVPCDIVIYRLVLSIH